MSISRSLILSAIILIVVVASCNVLKKEESNESIQAFVTSFQSSLALSDAEILKQFDTRQSSESILAAIRILQNKESAYFECVPSFQETAIIRGENDTIKVIIPAVFNAKNLEQKSDPVQTSFTISLQKKQKSFTIVRLDAETFYNSYATLKNAVQWSVQRREEIDRRIPIYQKAKELQASYDSVVWYCNYEGKYYFYVIRGEWSIGTAYKNSRVLASGYTMGLVDEAGAIVIPVEYELIGTIGFDYPAIVEIKRDGKVGYFDIKNRTVMLAPDYDLIIPYDREDVMMLARKDSTKGWINNSYEFEKGFPSSSSEDWFNSFGFLPTNLKISAGGQAICEIPNAENAGSGILIPPSYLVRTGLFTQLVIGLSTTTFPLNGWTEYVETKGTVFERISDKFNAVITTIKERYLEGRSEFYTYNKVIFVNAESDTVGVTDVYSDSVIYIRRLNDHLVEIKSAYSDTYYDPGIGNELDFPMYNYYALGENLAVTPLLSNRLFNITQFTKLDSSYLSGNFNGWNDETSLAEQFSFVPLLTLTYMRDELLASYGLIFPASEGNRSFSDFEWYSPRYNSVEEFRDQMTEIDQYNLEFLEKLINLMKDKPV